MAQQNKTASVIAKNVRPLMEKMNLNQEQLGEVSGVVQSTINKMLNEKNHSVYADTLIGLSKGLRVNIQDLVNEEFDAITSYEIIDEFANSELGRAIAVSAEEKAWFSLMPSAAILRPIPSQSLLAELIFWRRRVFSSSIPHPVDNRAKEEESKRKELASILHEKFSNSPLNTDPPMNKEESNWLFSSLLALKMPDLTIKDVSGLLEWRRAHESKKRLNKQ